MSVDQCTSPGHHLNEGTETRAVFIFLARHGGSSHFPATGTAGLEYKSDKLFTFNIAAIRCMESQSHVRCVNYCPINKMAGEKRGNAAIVKRRAEERVALFPVCTNGQVCGGLHVRNVTAMFVQQGQSAFLIRSVACLHVILSSLLYGASAVSYFLSVSLAAGTGAVYTVAEQ